MGIVKWKKEWIFDNVNEFVSYFKLEERFKNKYRVSIDDWEYEESDDVVIEELLKDLNGKYSVEYEDDGNCGLLKVRQY